MNGVEAYPAPEAGFRAGLARAAAALDAEMDVEGVETPPLLLELLAREEGAIHPRFASHFAEEFGVATAARRHAGEEEISYELALSYLETAREFFNCFTCP